MKPLDYALAYLGAGISVIPIRTDGSKAPDASLLPRVFDEDTGGARPSWKPFQVSQVDEATARSWWGRCNPPGIAALGGGDAGLELLDFDREADAIFPAWQALVEEEAPGLVDRLCLVKTPGGRHCWLRCLDGAWGNQKLASLSAEEIAGERALAKKEGRKPQLTLIETRGDGGYALVPGCPPACHPSGLTYDRVGGPPLWGLPPISLDEEEVLIRCARSFTREVPVEPPAPATPKDYGGRLRPGDDFDRRGEDWDEILGAAGWKCAGRTGQERRWRRPGKDGPGWSATTGHCRGQGSVDLLRVFSTNAEPFSDGKAYGKFRAYALLAHDGDLSAAARDLAAQGYGERARRELPRPTTTELERALGLIAAYPELVWDALLLRADVAKKALARLAEEGGR